MEIIKKCCDTCVFYQWYWDWCQKWKCEMDARALCDFWKSIKNN